MKHYLLAIAAAASSAWADEPPLSPDQLASLAASNNPEFRFFSEQVAALPRPSNSAAPKVAHPLDSPSRNGLRRAVLDLDPKLAGLYLEEFRYVLENTARLKAMEFRAAADTASTATDLAHRISALVKMLEERPAAGVESLLERRILEGAAIPFVKAAAEADVRANLLQTQLNGLLGRPANTPLAISWDFEPPQKNSETAPESPLLLKIRGAEVARGLAGLDPSSELEPFELGGWFTRDGLGASEPAAGTTRPSANSGSGNAGRLLAEDARAKWERELAQRKTATSAALDVAAAIPPRLIGNLRSASDLAERQYRVGAIGVNLLVEINRELLESLLARNDAVLQAWRNASDLGLLLIDTSESPKGTVSVHP